MDEFFWEETIEYSKRIGEINKSRAKKSGTKFFTGKVNVSDGIKQMGYSIDSVEIQAAFTRFINGDYGKQPKEDIEINEKAIELGYGDIMGEYQINGRKIWINTDLSEDTTTTIFLPEEW